MEIVKLKNVAKYYTKRTNSHQNYVSTKNIHPDKKGAYFPCPSIPDQKSYPRYNKNDILISNIRPYFQKIWLADRNGARSNDILDIHVYSNNVMQKYLYYVLLNNTFFKYMTKISNGTKMPRSNKTILMNYKIPVPSLRIQKKLVNLLSTIDKKVKLNKQNDQSLFHIIRNIYLSYYNKYNSSIITLGDLTNNKAITGKTPPTKDPSNYGYDIPFITIPDMRNQYFSLITTKKLSKKGGDSQPKKYLKPFSLNVSCIASPGLVIINPTISQANQQINSIHVSSKYLWLLFIEINLLRRKLLMISSGGTTLPNMNRKSFLRIKVHIFNDEIISKFNSIIKPMFLKILSNEKQNRTLRLLKRNLLFKFFN